MSPLRQLLITLAGLFVGLAISMGYLLFLGVGAGAIVNEFIVAIFTNARNIQAVLGFAAPLLLVGLSAAFGFRVRFWNIGIEGQVIFGAIAATFVATHDVGTRVAADPDDDDCGRAWRHGLDRAAALPSDPARRQ